MRVTAANLAAYLTRRITLLRQTHGFDRANGWAQVEGKTAAVQRAYGEFDALVELAQHFEVPA